jgi:membrane protein involved in colicin uptake
MAIEKQINLNVNSNIEGSISELRSLKRELKNTAAGSEDFKKLYNQIDDLEDKIKSAKNTSSDWVDSLEQVGGPLGSLGAGINKVKVSTQSFGAALKATGIGLIVSAVAGLAAAFSQNESAMKKLKPLTEAFEKILGGIFRALEPLIDSFMDLAMKALPYITQGIGLFYSGLVGLFTYVKEAGGGYIKMMKGIVTLDFDAAKEGFNQMKDSFNKAVKSGEDAYKRFESGSKEQTKAEKEELAKRREEQQKHQEELAKKQQEAAQKAAEERKRKADEARKAEEDRKKAELDLEQKYIDELLNLNAKTEQEKLDLQAQRDLEEINRIAKTENEKANLMALYNEKYAILNQELKLKADEEAAKEAEVKTEAEKAARDKKLAEEQAASKASIDLAKAEAKAKTDALDFYSGALGNIAGMLGESTDAGKAAAIASATISTYTSANKAYESQLAIPTPDAPVRAAVAAGIAIAGGLLNVQKILSVKTPGGGGGGSAPTAPAAPAAPSFNVVGAGGANQIAQVMSDQGVPPVQAFVVASNVTSAQSLNRNIVNNATLG